MLSGLAGSRWHHRPLLLLLPALAATSSCSDLSTVSLETDDIAFSLAVNSVDVPLELRSAGMIAELPCPTTDMCPSNDVVTVTCQRDLCDPAPRTITTEVEGVLDFDELTGDLSIAFRTVDAIEVRALSYTVELNTLPMDTGEVEVFWGPEGAVDIDPALGVRRLATIPAQRARTTSSGTADIDLAGSQALSDYLVSVERRIRLFVRTRVDLSPGDALPEGELRARVRATVDLSGPSLD